MDEKNNEKFYKNVCQKYVNTMSKEMLLDINDKILHIFIEDEYIDLKESGKINNQHYKDYLDGNFEIYEYNSYQELYDSTIKDEIAYDLNDLELFNSNNEWDFYITFEELKKMGYGFMVKDHYPLIEKYAVSSENIFDFFNHFSLEQLDDFEESLRMYFLENSIIYNEYEGLTVNPISHFEAKESYSFNSDILRLACGLITYEDFIEDYTEDPLSYYDKSLSKVIEYFKEHDIKDLMDYGSDGDMGLCPISSLYSEIMDKLDIKYNYVSTEDVSDGKYLTIITFPDNSEIAIDTSAWNGIKVVTENMESIYEKYDKLQKKSIGNEIENELAY